MDSSSDDYRRKKQKPWYERGNKYVPTDDDVSSIDLVPRKKSKKSCNPEPPRRNNSPATEDDNDDIFQLPSARPTTISSSSRHRAISSANVMDDDTDTHYIEPRSSGPVRTERPKAPTAESQRQRTLIASENSIILREVYDRWKKNCLYCHWIKKPLNHSIKDCPRKEKEEFKSDYANGTGWFKCPSVLKNPSLCKGCGFPRSIQGHIVCPTLKQKQYQCQMKDFFHVAWSFSTRKQGDPIDFLVNFCEKNNL